MWTKFIFSDLSIIYSKNPDSHTWSVTDMVESIEAKIPILHSKNAVVAAATSGRSRLTKLIFNINENYQKWVPHEKTKDSSDLSDEVDIYSNRTMNISYFKTIEAPMNKVISLNRQSEQKTDNPSESLELLKTMIPTQ